MTSDQQLIEAVLKSCGWTSQFIGQKFGLWYRSSDDTNGTENPPILTSLDACHEVFEKDAPSGYWEALGNICDGTCLCECSGLTYDESVLKATPRQRCLAWLKFKGVEI